MSTPARINDPFADYVQLVSAGLKHVNPDQNRRLSRNSESSC